MILVTRTTGERRKNVNPHRFGQDPIKVGRLGRDTVDQQGTSLDNPRKTVISRRLRLA